MAWVSALLVALNCSSVSVTGTAEQLDALVIFTDTRPLDKVGAWKHSKRLWQHRSVAKAHQERCRGLFVPLTTGNWSLAEVQCTWGESLLPKPQLRFAQLGLLLSDTDVAPTALFEVSELVDLCRHLLHEEVSLAS